MAQYAYDLSLKIPKPLFKTFVELIKLTFGVFFNCFGFIAVVVLLVNLPLLTIKEFAITGVDSTSDLKSLIFFGVLFQSSPQF